MLTFINFVNVKEVIAGWVLIVYEDETSTSTFVNYVSFVLFAATLRKFTTSFNFSVNYAKSVALKHDPLYPWLLLNEVRRKNHIVSFLKARINWIDFVYHSFHFYHIFPSIDLVKNLTNHFLKMNYTSIIPTTRN